GVAKRRVEADQQILTIQVVDPSGLPVSGAKLALFQDVHLLQSGTSAEDGAVHFEAAEGSASYVLVVKGWVPLRGELELSPGERTLALVEGELISGRVSVDGAAPNSPVDLSFSGLDPLRRAPVLPVEVLRVVRTSINGGIAIQALTEADGSFAFHGLSSRARGRIGWPEAYSLEGLGIARQERGIVLEKPERDLILRLVSRVQLLLRVVDPAGNPVPEALVRATGVGPSEVGIQVAQDWHFADQRGHSRLLLPAGVKHMVRVEVALNGGGAVGTHVLDVSRSENGFFDAGDLAVDTAQLLDVTVRDEAGKLLAGVAVATKLAGLPRLRRTDELGRLVCTLTPAEHELCFSAVGFQTVRLPVPPQASELAATLTRAPLLEFVLPVDVAGKQEFSLVLSGPTPLFIGGGEADLGAEQACSISITKASQAGTTCLVPASKDGHWKIFGLAPNQVVHALLRSHVGQTLSEIDVALKPAEEHRLVELPLQCAARSLLVRVVDPRGIPIERASVVVGDAKTRSSSLRHRVEERGELELTELYGERCTLFVRAPGFPDKLVVLDPIPAGPLDIVLDAPQSVEVEVAMGDGGPLPLELKLLASLDGDPLESGVRIAAGRYRFSDLPPSEVLLRAASSGVAAVQLHDARTPFVRMVLGESGRVTATTIQPVDGAESIWSLAIARPESPVDLKRSEFSFRSKVQDETSITGLSFGAYEAWLERRDAGAVGAWTRVGEAVKIVLDAEHPSASIELRP
ncbi:MAG TPA: hypothetical protein VK843_14215, partial [Planctomycetota bacterium]|nr:hypothetical protein [Planctomycetota bacterium]